MAENHKEFDEIHKILLESSRQILKLNRSQAKTDAQIMELKESQSKTDAQIMELKESQSKTDAQIAQTDVQIMELKESQSKTDAQIAQTDAQIAQTDVQMKETFRKLESIGQRLGSMGNNIGYSSEEFFYRGFKDNPALGNIVFNRVERWVRQSENDQEIDILLINGSSVAIIEVKFKAHPQQLREIKAKKIRSFRENHHIYRKHKLYFGIASMSTNLELINAAKDAGIFLITQKGEHLVVSNAQAESA